MVAIHASLLYWITIPGLVVLGILLPANNVATTVAMAHGAKAAQWRHLLYTTFMLYFVGFYLGQMCSSSFFVSIFTPLFKHLTFSSTLISRFLTSLLSVIVVNSMSLMASLYFQFCVPITSTLLTSLYMAMAVAQVIPLNGDPGWTLLFAGTLLPMSLSILLVAITFRYFTKSILESGDGDGEDPLARAITHLPYLFAGFTSIHFAALSTLVLTYLLESLRTFFYIVFLGNLLIGFPVAFFLARLFVVNRSKRHAFARYPQQFQEYSMMAAAAEERRVTERGMVPEPYRPASPAPTRGSRGSGGGGTMTTMMTGSATYNLNRARAEESFAYLLLTITATNSLVQGVIDGGVMGGFLQLILNAFNHVPLETPLGGIASKLIMFLGMSSLLLGHWSARRLARDITAIGPVMALAGELASSLVLLLPVCIWAAPTSTVIVKLPTLLMVGHLSGRDVNWKGASCYAAIGILSLMLTTAVAAILSLTGTLFQVKF